MSESNEIFTPDHVFLDLDAKSKRNVFECVSKMAEKVGVTNSASSLCDAIAEREEDGMTGLMDGFAIPHAKTSVVIRPSMFYVRVKHPLEWETLDGEGVSSLFALVSPDGDKGSSHLKMLSALATCLLEDDFKETVKRLETADELVSYVNDCIAKESDKG